MRLIRVSSNANTTITSLNNNVLKLYTKISMGQLKYNKKPFTEIHRNREVPKILDDIGNSMQICFHQRPYKIYYIANEFNIEPNLLYMRHWVDVRKEKVKALCIMDYISYEDISFFKHRSKDRMDGVDLDFMFMLCDSLNTGSKHF